MAAGKPPGNCEKNILQADFYHFRHYNWGTYQRFFLISPYKSDDMKKFVLQIICSLVVYAGYAQSLSHVTLSGATSLKSFSFSADQQAIIRLSPDGNVLEWGVEMQQGQFGYYQGRLLPFMGRVDYYGPEADEAYRGKVKNIGNCTITYYASSMPQAQKGKVKTIGTAMLDYYMDYDDESSRGKLKTAGNLSITYYGSYENESYKGKLKTVGNTSLAYYSVFDDSFNKGKIKSIGSFAYTWYNNFDRKELQGAMKSGATIQKINGVTYSIW